MCLLYYCTLFIRRDIFIRVWLIYSTKSGTNPPHRLWGPSFGQKFSGSCGNVQTAAVLCGHFVPRRKK